MSKKLIKTLALLVVMVLVFSFAACGSTETKSADESTKSADTQSADTKATEPEKEIEPVEIEFWAFSNWATGIEGDEFKSYISEFQTANPSITVKLVGKPDTEIQSGIITGAGSGVLPDCFAIAYNVGYDIVKTGAVKDITSEWGALPAEYISQFQKSAVDGLNVDGKVWGIPMTAYDTILYRNLTVLKKAGIDPSAGIKDWADWIEQMKAVKKAGFEVIPNYAIDGWATMSYLGGVDGVVNGLKDGKTTITDTQMATCFKMMKDVSQFGTKVGAFDQPATDLFVGNKMGFFMMGPWADPNFAKAKADGKLDYDFVPIPGEKAGITGGVKGGEWLAITDGKKADAAFKWISFLADKKQMTRYAAKAGRLLFNEEAMNDPEVQKNALVQVCSKALQGGMADAAYFQLFPLTIRQPIADNAGAVIKGSKTPEQGGKDAVEGIDKAIEDAK